MAECHARGWSPETEDEADALAILHYARHCLGDTTAAPISLVGVLSDHSKLAPRARPSFLTTRGPIGARA